MVRLSTDRKGFGCHGWGLLGMWWYMNTGCLQIHMSIIFLFISSYCMCWQTQIYYRYTVSVRRFNYCRLCLNLKRFRFFGFYRSRVRYTLNKLSFAAVEIPNWRPTIYPLSITELKLFPGLFRNWNYLLFFTLTCSELLNRTKPPIITATDSTRPFFYFLFSPPHLAARLFDPVVNGVDPAERNITSATLSVVADTGSGQYCVAEPCVSSTEWMH